MTCSPDRQPARTAAHGRDVARQRDTALLEALAYGRDEAAFEVVYRRHAPAVHAAAFRVCRDTAAAEDITQKAFLGLWERSLRLAARSVCLRPWLLTVARNAAIDYLRARAIARSAGLIAPAEQPCPQDLAVTGALIAGLRPALAALPPARRCVIELHYFAGLSYAEIARRTGKPLGTVKSRGRLALDELRNSAAVKGRLG